jgi:hypothetical protein
MSFEDFLDASVGSSIRDRRWMVTGRRSWDEG